MRQFINYEIELFKMAYKGDIRLKFLIIGLGLWYAFLSFEIAQSLYHHSGIFTAQI